MQTKKKKIRIRKAITLLGESIGGWRWDVRAIVLETGRVIRNDTFHPTNTHEGRQRNKWKIKIRGKDKNWLYHVIPSSLWWGKELHHDWEDSGRMYLLTKGEHILRHRREKEHGKSV